MAAAQPADPKWRRNLAISYIKLGDRSYTTLDYGKAASRVEDVVKRLQPLLDL